MTPIFFTIIANLFLAVVVGGVSHHLRYDPRWLWADWSAADHVPFVVADEMELATSRGRLKRGSLRAVCENGAVRLALRKRLILGREGRWRPRAHYAYDTRTYIAFGQRPVSDSFETGSSLVKWGLIDTVVTAPLTAEQSNLLLAWHAQGAPGRISLQTMENAAFKTAVAHPEALAAFVRRCGG